MGKNDEGKETRELASLRSLTPGERREWDLVGHETAAVAQLIMALERRVEGLGKFDVKVHSMAGELLNMGMRLQELSREFWKKGA